MDGTGRTPKSVFYGYTCAMKGYSPHLILILHPRTYSGRFKREVAHRDPLINGRLAEEVECGLAKGSFIFRRRSRHWDLATQFVLNGGTGELRCLRYHLGVLVRGSLSFLMIGGYSLLF